MLIIVDTGAAPRITSIAERPRGAIVDRQLADPQPAPEEGQPPPDPVFVDIEIVPAETDTEFRARMVALHVPAGARHLVDPALPDGVPPERWDVDWSTGEITQAPLSQADLLAYADQCRTVYRDSGTTATLGDVTVPVRTDRMTKNDVVAAVQTAERVANWSTPWKLANGAYVTIDAAAIIVIADAIDAHWRDAYAKEATAAAGIGNGTITTKTQVDAVFA